jgi:hypothetical protein
MTGGASFWYDGPTKYLVMLPAHWPGCQVGERCSAWRQEGLDSACGLESWPCTK